MVHYLVMTAQSWILLAQGVETVRAVSNNSFFFGSNAIGLRRLGFPRERIKAIKAMFQLIFFSDLNTSQALARIEEEIPPSEDREEILSFIQTSRRGFVKKASDEWTSKDLA